MKRGAAHQLSYRLLHWTPIQRIFNFASQGKKVLHSKRCHRLQKSYLKLVQSFTTCTVGYESDRSAIYHQLCISSNPKPGNDEIMDQYNFCDMRHQLKFNCIARGLVQPSQYGWLGGGCPSLYRSYIPRLSYHIGCTVLMMIMMMIMMMIVMLTMMLTIIVMRQVPNHFSYFPPTSSPPSPLEPHHTMLLMIKMMRTTLR